MRKLTFFEFYGGRHPLPPLTWRQRHDRWWYAVCFYPGWRVMYAWQREEEDHTPPVAALRAACQRLGLWRSIGHHPVRTWWARRRVVYHCYRLRWRLRQWWQGGRR